MARKDDIAAHRATAERLMVAERKARAAKLPAGWEHALKGAVVETVRKGELFGSVSITDGNKSVSLKYSVMVFDQP